MPKIIANKKKVLDIVGKDISDKELYEVIPYLGTDLEEIDDEFIHVEIFPNRPDLLSSEGLGRALKTFLKDKQDFNDYKVHKSDYIVNVDKSVDKVRPYTVCAVIKNIEITELVLESIINLQEKLHITHCRNRKKAAIGVYDLDKIKFPVNYKALNIKDVSFKPLGFDKEMKGLDILKNTDVGKKYAHLMDDKLTAVFKDSNDNVMSMPPIVNSNFSGNVSNDTKNLFLEVSGFELKTLEQALNILVTSILENGGECYEVTVKSDDYTKKYPSLKSKTMEVDLNYINKVSGLNLNENEAQKYLGKMGINYLKGSASIPCYRADFLHPIDLVEDCIIGFGYDNIKGSSKSVFTKGKLSDIERFKNKLRDYLIGFGFIETISYNLSDSFMQKKYFNDVLMLKNSLSEKHDSLRRSLLFSAFETLKENRNNTYPQSFFELGKVFESKEVDSLGVMVCGESSNYMSVKGVLDNLFSYLNISEDLKLKPSDFEMLIEGRQAKVYLKDNCIGFLGEVHPNLINNYDIEFPCAFLELDLNELMKFV